MKDNEEFIKGIYNKYDEYVKDNKSKCNNKKPNKWINNTIKIISSVAVILIVSTLIIIDKDKSIKLNGKEICTYRPENSSLATVDTFDNFYQIIKDYSSSNNYDLATNSKQEILKDSINSESTVQEESKSLDYSTTNNQVSNVEEADIVKTDGNYIYYVTNNKLIIIDNKDPKNLKETYKEDYKDSNFSPQEIYIYNSKLVVLGNTYISSRDDLKTFTNSTMDCVSYNNKTKAIIYDISNKENVSQVRELELTGNLLSSRMINDCLYIVSNQYINTYRILKREISEFNGDEYKPVYRDTAISKEEKKIEYNQIECFDEISSANFLTIAGINVNNNEEANIKTFLGSGSEIYVSENNMYIAKNNINYNYSTREMQSNSTKILKLSLNNTDIDYKAEADIPGYINNQFSMDESNGTFKIATTIGAQWVINEKTTNSLFILDENLEELGRIEELAKGEKIYSVRYTNDRAYIVTYKQVDPLFVIDISDSKNPTLLGELKIEGYSTYLHPYDENHLIGFGYDTKFNGRTTTTNGLKMVMFDITDLSNPKELFKVEIGDRYTSSSLLYNHKALLFSKEKNIIGFPINSYKNKSIYKAQIYNIDLENGFTLKGEIIQNSSTNQIERIIYIGNIYYTVSQNEIQAIDMNTLEELSSIKL